jgi:hypothetical protein
MKINISKYLVDFFLFLSKSFSEDKFLVVCKGYGDDYELFTGLNWEEDKDLDFIHDKQYSDFQLWLN